MPLNGCVPARCALRGTDAENVAAFHDRRDRVVGCRHRRQHRCLRALIDAVFTRSPAGTVRGDELVAFHQVEPRQSWWEFASYPDYVHYR